MPISYFKCDVIAGAILPTEYFKFDFVLLTMNRSDFQDSYDDDDDDDDDDVPNQPHPRNIPYLWMKQRQMNV